MEYILYTIVLVFLGDIICIDPLVLTKNGIVRGLPADDGKYAIFFGITYAKVDVNNPFGHATKAANFEGIFNAIHDDVICPQQDDLDLSIVGTIDCLVANIYVPDEASSNNKLPVMVWIHGGGFRRWSSNRSSYGPKFLVRMGVILVTFNYRLGPYGFMSLNTTDIPGNAGLRDQLLALEWVKENIGAFGGDENNITLFGESAGAASVEFHMLSGHSSGLFHRAILQSGTVLCDWVMREPDLRSPIRLAEYMGLQTDDIDEALRYISQSEAHDLIRATIGIGYAESFKPSVEVSFEGVKAMIKDKPSNLLRNKANRSIPMIIGFNSREQQRNLYYYLQSPDDYFDKSEKTFKAKISKYFVLNDDELVNAENIVRHFYIGSEDIGNNVNEMLEFDSDFTFIHPILRDIRYHQQIDANSLYLYMFDYAGERNYMKYRLNMTSESGAVHADEIGYLFDQSYYTGSWTTTDNMIIFRMSTMWSDFAKTGNPTPKATELVPFTWREATADPTYAVLNYSVRMTQHPYSQRMAFWDLFLSLYQDKLKW